MAVLADGGFGVAVDVEGVRHLRPAPLAIPDAHPDGRLRPGRRPGGRFGHADLVRDGWRVVSVNVFISSF